MPPGRCEPNPPLELPLVTVPPLGGDVRSIAVALLLPGALYGYSRPCSADVRRRLRSAESCEAMEDRCVLLLRTVPPAERKKSSHVSSSAVLLCEAVEEDGRSVIVERSRELPLSMKHPNLADRSQYPSICLMQLLVLIGEFEEILATESIQRNVTYHESDDG